MPGMDKRVRPMAAGCASVSMNKMMRSAAVREWDDVRCEKSIGVGGTAKEPAGGPISPMMMGLGMVKGLRRRSREVR